MLSVLHPRVVPLVEDLSVGIWPFLVKDKGIEEPKLIVKTSKEMILTVKMNQNFKIYVVPFVLAGEETAGLISAFFDDPDEPLVIFTPLFDDDMTRALIETLRCKTLDIHFFDEHSREMLGYTCELTCSTPAQHRLEDASFPSFNLQLAQTALRKMPTWFGTRTTDDDANAISVRCGENLVPDDLLIIDARPDRHPYQGSPGFSFSQLDREEPGPSQERDIARLLGRLFLPQQIYINPFQVGNNEEIADILVITETDILVVQAKDRPNIERVLSNTIQRKKLATRKALLKAIDQAKGAIRYLKSASPAKMLVSGGVVEVDVSNLRMRSLIIVKELFNDEYSEYSPPILALAEESQVSCIALDYPELVRYTEVGNCEEFFVAFDRVSSHATTTRRFPRLRIWPGRHEPL